MTNLKNKIEKLETATKPELLTVKELVDFVLCVQRGQASIHSATIGEPLLKVGPHVADAARWLARAERLAAKHDVPLDQVKRDMIAYKPELGVYLS